MIIVVFDYQRSEGRKPERDSFTMTPQELAQLPNERVRENYIQAICRRKAGGPGTVVLRIQTAPLKQLSDLDLTPAELDSLLGLYGGK